MKYDNERGMVLLLVLVIIALLSAMLSEFAFSTLVDFRLTETFRDVTRAEYLARGGIKAGRIILINDRNNFDANVASEAWSIGVSEYPVAEGAVSVKIEDLDGRLQLNELVDSLGNPNELYRERFIRLCSELAIAEATALADTLIDWLDPDHTPAPEGAEDADYLAESLAYEASDGPLRSFDELLLVHGFSAQTVARLQPYVTVFGSGRLNINTAEPELLRSWDAEAASAVEDLLARRDEKPYTRLEELKEAIGLEAYTALNRNLDLGVSSAYYHINSRARVNDGVRAMEAVVDKSQNLLLWQKVN